jgi:TP901 family phage tail tape measure protein
MAFKVGAIYGEAILDTNKWEKGTNKIGSTLKATTKAITTFTAVAGAAFTAFVVTSTKKADDYQKALSNVSTLLDDTQVSMAGLSSELLMMDSSLGSTIDLTEGLYQAISAGADPASDALDVVADSAMFAKAALTDTATAVDVLTTATNAYGKDVVSTSQASDIFFTTIKQGKITGEQLSSTIGQSIPLFASLNVPLEQLASGMAAMTKQGISAAESTTQLNAIMNAFLKPSDEMTEALKNIGFESGAAFIEAEGLEGALAFLEEQTGGNKDSLAKLLPNVRALKGAMALTGEGGKEFIAVLEEMEMATGSTEEAFLKQEKTWNTLANTFGKTQIIVGNMGKFFADDLAGGLDDVLESVNEFLLSEEGFNKINDVIIKIAGGFSVFKEITKQLFEPIKNVYLGIVDTLNSEMSQLNMDSDKVIDTFDILAGIMKILGSSMVIVGKVTNLLITSIFNLGKVAKDSFDTVSAFIRFVKGEAKFDEVKDNFADVGGSLEELGVDFKDGIIDIFETTKDEFADFSVKQSEQADSLRDTWDKSTDEMAQKVVDNYNKMVLGAEDATKELTEVSKKGGENAGTEITTSFNDRVKAGSDKFQKNWDNFVSPAIDAATFVANQVASAIDAVFDTVIMGLDNELAAIQMQNDAKMEQLLEHNEAVRAEEETRQMDELAALEESFQAGLITEDQYLAQKASIEDKHAQQRADTDAKLAKKLADQKKKQRDKENAKKKEIFEAQKANQIANIWIQYAIGLMGLWAQSIAQLGPIAGSILAGIMTGVLTGVAIAQTVVVSQQQFIPEKKIGGMASGLTRINEAGGEIVSLPDGSQVIPNDISRQIAANSGNTGNKLNINVSFAGAKISDNMSLRKVSNFVISDMTEQLRGVM